MEKNNPLKKRVINLKCGAGGIRTLVQTGNTQAFYMLILLLIFDTKQTTDRQLCAYFLKFSSTDRNFPWLISAFPIPPDPLSQNRTLGRHLVSLLYFGKNVNPTKLQIKQQEQTLRCQLKCCSKGLKRSRYGSLHAYLPTDPAVETGQPQR